MTLLVSLAAIAALFAGATVKGILGIGLPMVAIPLLTLVTGLPQALAIASLPVAAANLLQVWQFRRAPWRPRVVLPFLAAGGVGTVIGTLVLVHVDDRWLELALAVMLSGYIVLRIGRPGFSLGARVARIAAAPTGFAAGILHGTTGISGPLSITFCHAQDLGREEFVLTTGLVFLVLTLVQIPALAAAGIMSTATLWAGAIGVPTIAAGLWFGNRLAKHVSARLFDRLILAVLCWTVIALVWRG